MLKDINHHFINGHGKTILYFMTIKPFDKKITKKNLNITLDI